jgi:hypothetical protein
MEDTQIQTQEMQNSAASNDIANQMSMLHLSQNKLQEMEAKRSHLLPAMSDTRNLRHRSESLDLDGTNDIINCQCGCDREEGDMVKSLVRLPY